LYDAIVVGARCAGSPTAMLLARKGFKVLLVDRAHFPSDIMSTHFIHPPGVARLSRWGVLDAVMATGVPPLGPTVVQTGPMRVAQPRNTSLPDPICPRRTLLDKVLVDAAVAAGAELREGFTVNELTTADGRVTGVRGHGAAGGVTEEARIVIGADGLRSTVARAVKPEEYKAVPTRTCGYYAYWSGIDLDHAELFFGPTGGVLVFPTNDKRTCVAVGWPVAKFHEVRTDIEGHYMATLNSVPELAAMMKTAKQEERFIGTADNPNYFRKPFGPGWALVGDAGYHKDFATGLGITDALRDADLLAAAIDAGFSGRQPIDEALGAYEAERNDIATPMYEFTLALTAEGPVGPEAMMKFAAAMART